MKRDLHKTTNGLQTIEIHDTLLYDVIITFNKGDDESGKNGNGNICQT